MSTDTEIQQVWLISGIWYMERANGQLGTPYSEKDQCTGNRLAHRILKELQLSPLTTLGKHMKGNSQLLREYNTTCIERLSERNNVQLKESLHKIITLDNCSQCSDKDDSMTPISYY